MVLLAILDFFGIIWHNAPFTYFYSVKGLDVSWYQKTIDWKKVADTHKYSFVFIKATEGNDYTDDNFSTNWKEANEKGLLVGAYHFFSTRSSGKEQAIFFISKVPKINHTLPPVIDIEIDLNKDTNKIRGELKELADQLQNHYEKRPILYVTYDTYNTYIKGYFTEYNIWIRDVFKPPYLNERSWSIWQYNNRGKVEGINTYVDINVFKGSLDELKKLAEQKLDD